MGPKMVHVTADTCVRCGEHGKSTMVCLLCTTPPAPRTGLFRPTTALQTPPGGVPASYGMWANARRRRLGALIRLLCGDGAVSIEATMR
jgi:hypothetical protein